MFDRVLNKPLEKQPPEVFYKKGVLKKRLWHRCFLVNFAKLLRTPFWQNTSVQLLLPLKCTDTGTDTDTVTKALVKCSVT